jgi:hypothetical protein
MPFTMHSARAMPAAGSGSHSTLCPLRVRVAVVSHLGVEEEGHPEGGSSAAAEAAPRLALGPPLLPAAHQTGCAQGR